MIDMPHLIVSLLDSSLMICVFYPVLDALWWSLWLPVWRGQRQRLKAKGRLHTFFQCSCFLFLSIYIGLDETFTLTAQFFLHFDLWRLDSTLLPTFGTFARSNALEAHHVLAKKTGWWFGTCFIFPYLGNFIIPTDELILFRGIGSTYEKYSPSIFLSSPTAVCWLMESIPTTSTRQAFRSKQSPCESAPWRCLLAKKNVSESKAHHDLKWSTNLGYALNGNHWLFYEDGVWFMIFSSSKNWMKVMLVPIGSMYAIYGNIYHQYTPNVSVYTIHGSYGVGSHLLLVGLYSRIKNMKQQRFPKTKTLI